MVYNEYSQVNGEMRSAWFKRRRRDLGNEYYSTGEFAKRANVSVRTIHYYEKLGLIRPKKIGSNGYRYYGEEEFARIQRILTLKLLGFSLEEIQELSLNESNTDFLQHSFEMQLSLVRKKIEHLKAVEESIQNVSRMFSENDTPDWSEITKLIGIINMDRELVEQYQNGKNLDARIQLHKYCSQNSQSWFCWIFEHMNLGEEKVLELGCGDGTLWLENADAIPAGAQILLSELSAGMLEDTRKKLDGCPGNFSYEVIDCHQIGKPNHSFELVIANFVLFYVRDLKRVFSEIRRVLRPGGRFLCATYGEEHMKEVEELVKEFNPKIRLSSVHLYDNFGLANGEELLKKHFSKVQRFMYPDVLKVTDVKLLMDYILSCHGNQKEFLVPEYDRFKAFLERKLAKKGYIRITKQAGIFLAE